MKSTKAITNMAFNTAIGCAFAIPARRLAGSLEQQHIGGKVAAVLALAELFVNLLWPDQGAVPHLYQPLNGQDLEAAMKDLTADIAGIVQDLKLDSITDDVVGLLKTYNDNWSQVLLLKIDQKNPAFNFIQDPTQRDFVKSIEVYFDIAAGAGHLTTAYARLNSVTSVAPILTVTPMQRAAFQNQIFPVYMLVGSFISAYLKAAVVWRWGNEWRASLAWEKWVADAVATPNAKPVRPPQPMAMPAWQEWRKQAGCPINRLVDEVNELVAYCEGADGLYTNVNKRWNDRLAKTLERAGQISVHDDYDPWLALDPMGAPPTQYWVEDSKTGFKSAGGTQGGKAQLLQQAMAGSQIAYEWARWTREYDLEKVDGDDIKTFGDTIEQWKLTRNSVLFSEVVVRAGQHTFESVALSHFPILGYVANPADRAQVSAAVGALAQRISDYNKDDSNPSPKAEPGKAVKIPEIDPYDAGAGAPSTAAGNSIALIDAIHYTLDHLPNAMYADALTPAAARVAAGGRFMNLLAVGSWHLGARKLAPAALSEADLIATIEQLVSELSPLLSDVMAAQAVRMCLKTFFELHGNWSALLALKLDAVTFDFAQDDESLAAVDQLNQFSVPLQALVGAATKLSHRGAQFAPLALLCGTLAIASLSVTTHWRWGNKLRRGLKWDLYQMAAGPNQPEPPADAEQSPTWPVWQRGLDCPVRALLKTAFTLSSSLKSAPAFQGNAAGFDPIFEAWKAIGERYDFTIYVAHRNMPVMVVLVESYGPAHGGNLGDQQQYIKRYHGFFLRRLREVNRIPSPGIAKGTVLVIPEIDVADYPA